MALLTPLAAVVVSFCFLGVMLYKRVSIGIALNVTAIILALLSLSWVEIPKLIYETTTDILTISVVLATFGIMLLSQLYSETGIINHLSKSLSGLIRNPKIVISILPAIIGFLPVAGGALMSAPLVDSEAEKLELRPEKKTYVNLWFRHTIFPMYPLNQALIITVALTGMTMGSIILRQIPAVIVMIIIGYFVGLRSKSQQEENRRPRAEVKTNADLKSFLVTFSPILTAILVAIVLSSVGFELAQQGFDVFIAVLAGMIVLIAISRLSLAVFAKPFKTWAIYSVTLASYGAFLLRSTIMATEIPEIFQTLAANGSVNTLLLLTVVPALSGFLTGSPSGGVALSISILSGIMNNFTVGTAALIYMSCYLGYLIAPIHLCLTFTAEYFKCPFGKMYKYVIPSFLITFGAAILTYFLVV